MACKELDVEVEPEKFQEKQFPFFKLPFKCQVVVLQHCTLTEWEKFSKASLRCEHVANCALAKQIAYSQTNSTLALTWKKEPRHVQKGGMDKALWTVVTNPDEEETETTETSLIDLGANESRKKNGKTVAKLIELGADVNFRDRYDSWSVLHQAIRAGELGNLQKLFGGGADASVVDNQGNTLFHAVACIEAIDTSNNIIQMKKIAKLLLDKNVPINAPNRSFESPLHLAAEENYCAVVTLVECGAAINAPDPEGLSALLVAIRSSNESRAKLVAYLLEKGADKHATDQQGSTLMHYAVLSGDPETVTCLIQAGVEVDQPDEDGCTPLLDVCKVDLYGANRSVEPNSSERLTCTEERSDNESSTLRLSDVPLHETAAHNIPRIAQALLSAGADPNKKDVHNKSPLQCAVLAGNIQLISVLMDGGADPEVRDDMGCTALLRATLIGNGEVVKALIDGGADTEARYLPFPPRLPGGHWEQPPGKAVRQTHLQSLRTGQHFLLGKLPAQCLLDSDFTSLHSAAMKGKNEALEALLGYQVVDVTAVTNNGNTALHLAMVCEQLGAGVLLLKAGVNTAALNEQRQKPTDMAAIPAEEFLPRVRDDWFRNGVPSGAPPRIAADMAKANKGFLAGIQEKILPEFFLRPVCQSQKDSSLPPPKRQKREECSLETALEQWYPSFCSEQFRREESRRSQP